VQALDVETGQIISVARTREHRINIGDNIPENSTIAILDISSTSRTPTMDIRNNLTLRLFNSRRFALVDRANIDTIIREQRLQWSGEIDTRTASDLGGFAGANVIITGNLISTSFSYNVTTTGLHSGIVQNRSGNSRHLTLQALDVETGRVISMEKIHSQSGHEDAIFFGERSAIIRALDSLMGDIPRNSKISIAGVSSNDRNKSANFTDEITYRLFTTGNFQIMNRGDLDRIRGEQAFGVSGQVDRETAAELRRLHGVSVIITGTLSTSGNISTLTLTALDTETARVLAMAREEITVSFDRRATVNTFSHTF